MGPRLVVKMGGGGGIAKPLNRAPSPLLCLHKPLLPLPAFNSAGLVVLNLAQGSGFRVFWVFVRMACVNPCCHLLHLSHMGLPAHLTY